MGMDVTTEHVTTQAAANVLLTSITIFFPLFLMLILLYETLRPRLPHVYSPENHVDFPKSNQRKFLSWVPFVWHIDEAQVAEKCGLDAWVLLRFMKMGRKVALLCVLCSGALFPMYFFTAAVFEAQKRRHHLSRLLPDGGEAGNATIATITSMMMIMLNEQLDVGNSTANILSSDGKVKLDIIDRLTIANVGKDDWRLYFTVLVSYMISIYVMRLLLDEYTVYRKRRHEFLMRKHPQQYSVVISDLPESQRHPQTLQAYLEYLFPNSVHSVYIGVECSELERLLGKRQELVYHLYAANLKLAEMKNKVSDHDVNKRPKEWIGRRFFGLCGGGKQVDAVDHYTDMLQKLEAEIVRVRDEILQRQATEKAQNLTNKHQYGSMNVAIRGLSTLTELAEKLRKTKSLTDDRRWGEETLPLLFVSVPVPKRVNYLNVMRSCAFVSFRSIRSAQAAQQLLQVENPRRMIVLPAPNIRDVHWKNFGLPQKLKAKWKLISMGVSLLIGCFWTVPTTFVASMASVDELRHSFPWLGSFLKKNPWLLIALQQTAPLVYSAMNGLANVIFKLLSTQEGHLSISEVEASRFTKLCFFQAFQMFFVSALAGSIITEFMVFLDQPRMFFFFLGNTIANQSMMFITFIITQVCVGMSLFLLRVSPLAISAAYHLLAPMHAKIPQPRGWMGLCPVNFQTDLDTPMNLAQQYLVFLLVVVFTPIAPLVGYFGVMFFVVSELAYKRCFFFINSSRWASTNSMGVFWPPLYSFVIGALVIGQCTLIGLLSLKSAGYGPVGLMSVLPLSTLIFHWYAVDLSHLKRAAENLPLDQCCDIDEERKDDSFDFLDGVYQQPAMIEAFHPASILTCDPDNGAGAATDFTNEQADDPEPHVEPLNKPAKPLNQQTRLAELNKDKQDEIKTTE